MIRTVPREIEPLVRTHAVTDVTSAALAPDTKRAALRGTTAATRIRATFIRIPPNEPRPSARVLRPSYHVKLRADRMTLSSSVERHDRSRRRCLNHTFTPGRGRGPTRPLRCPSAGGVASMSLVVSWLLFPLVLGLLTLGCGLLAGGRRRRAGATCAPHAARLRGDRGRLADHDERRQNRASDDADRRRARDRGASPSHCHFVWGVQTFAWPSGQAQPRQRCTPPSARP